MTKRRFKLYEHLGNQYGTFLTNSPISELYEKPNKANTQNTK